MEDEIRWRVGSGETISIRYDRWLPKHTGGYIQNSVVNNSATMVANLIDKENQCWNDELITSVFSSQDANVIHCIPLPRSSMEDKLV